MCVCVGGGGGGAQWYILTNIIQLQFLLKDVLVTNYYVLAERTRVQLSPVIQVCGLGESAETCFGWGLGARIISWTASLSLTPTVACVILSTSSC